MQSSCGGGVAARPRLPGARSGLPCPVPGCYRRGRLAGAKAGSHCGVGLGDRVGILLYWRRGYYCMQPVSTFWEWEAPANDL
jgi:hypothetical protein